MKRLAKEGSVLVALLGIVIGLVVGFAGLALLEHARDLASAQGEERTFLGLFGESSASASVPVEPWVGLVLLVAGAAFLLFGLRALFTAFEGRSDLG